MNIAELISKWEHDHNWVGDVPNFFLKKEVTIYPNPACTGEIIILFFIAENTYFVDGNLSSFYDCMQFQTFNQSRCKDLNENGDAVRLEQELKKFTSSAKKKREEQLHHWKQEGKIITTSNPLCW